MFPRVQGLCLALALTTASCPQQRLELELWLQLELNSACLELQLTQTVCGTWLYNCLTTTCFLWASHLHRIQPFHRSRWCSDMFDQMHLFLDWRLGRRPICYIQTFFVQAFKIVVDYWKFSILLLYILWHDWPIFMISGSNQQLQQESEYTLLKPDCHCWWISKMQSGREEEWYAIKLRFKLGKTAATETYGMLQTAFRPSCMNRASVSEWHKRFKEDRESVRDDERCGRSWLAQG